MSGIVRTTSLGLCFLLGTNAFAGAQAPQTASPTPANVPSATQSADITTYQLNVKVTRVVLDVVVTDGKGRPVQGLTQDDFTVLEDGAVQPVRSFDAHTAIPAATPPPPPVLHLPPNIFTNLATAPPDKPVTILLYDMLNTPQSALPYAHQALVRFIKDRKSSTNIAIFALTDRLHMLQGFTDDETRLMAAIDSKTMKSHNSQLRIADTGADAAALLAGDPAAASSPSQPVVAPTSADEILTQLNDAVSQEQDYLAAQRIQTTVDAFASIARFVATLPGRKNLIWMAGAFPVELWPGRKPPSAGAGDFNIAARFSDQMRETQEVLKDSRVAIYPVDVRGLQADPQFAATTTLKLPARVPIGGGGPPPPPSFGVQQGAEHATMDAIAESSGGRAFYNTNGLQEAMDAAIRQGSNYYTLTYAPTNGKEDGGERKVKVALKNAKYQLIYRDRYLAPDAAHPAPLRALALDMNMQHGAPASSELFFEAGVVPVGGAMQASSAEAQGLRTFLQTNARGKRTKILQPEEKVQHYDINLAIIGRQLEMPPTRNGQYATSMRFGLAAYTQNSELLNGTEVTVKNEIAPAQYQKILTEGYHASMLFAVPQDAVSLRIAVRDEIGNRIGTLEVPLPIAAPKNNSPAGTSTK